MSGTSQHIENNGTAIVTVNNGLTDNAGTIQLGGALVQDVNIDGAYIVDFGGVNALTQFNYTVGNVLGEHTHSHANNNTYTLQSINTAGDYTMLFMNNVGVFGPGMEIGVYDSTATSYSKLVFPTAGILDINTTSEVNIVTSGITMISNALGSNKIMSTGPAGLVSAVTLSSPFTFLFGTLALSGPTGWGTPTGTLARTTFDSTTITHADLAQRVAALITDLKTTGIIKA